MKRLRLIVAALAAVLTLASAQEVQPQELVFEKWVRDTFFGGYRPAGYAQRWDIPATENKDHGDIPVNPKVARLGTAVDLGDALLQYEIDEPFMLIIGFWQQEGDTKRLVNIIAPEIPPERAPERTRAALGTGEVQQLRVREGRVQRERLGDTLQSGSDHHGAGLERRATPHPLHRLLEPEHGLVLSHPPQPLQPEHV